MSVVGGYAIGRDKLQLDARLALCANLVGVAAIWIRADKPVEGTVLIVVTPRHGLTEADLLALVPLSLVFVALSGHWSRVADLVKRK